MFKVNVNDIHHPLHQLRRASDIEGFAKQRCKRNKISRSLVVSSHRFTFQDRLRHIVCINLKSESMSLHAYAQLES